VEFFFDILREHFANHGYLTVAIALLLENAGLPVPGESILLFASFTAYSEGTIKFPILVTTAILACAIGDNIGYWLGSTGGRSLLVKYQKFFHISQATLDRSEATFAKYGAVTVFVARFIFGLRVIAGPVAGVLKMPWGRFVIFNVLGAIVWVSAITTVGALFGRHWDDVMEKLGEVNGSILVGVVIVLLLWWRFRKRS
jgi:membrane-associated protein